MNSNDLSQVLALADDGLIYKTASDIHKAVTAVQKQLHKVSHWCQETESEINPSMAQALWCTLKNKAVGQAMPAAPFKGEVVERTNNLRYLGIHFDRMLTRRTRHRSSQQNSSVRKDCPHQNPGLQEATNNAICSCCIRVSLTMVWAHNRVTLQSAKAR